MAIRTVQVLAKEEVPAGSAGSLACTKSEELSAGCQGCSRGRGRCHQKSRCGVPAAVTCTAVLSQHRCRGASFLPAQVDVRLCISAWHGMHTLRVAAARSCRADSYWLLLALQVHEFSTSAAESMFVTAINRQQDVIFDGCVSVTVVPIVMAHLHAPHSSSDGFLLYKQQG
jgi:hypothetical protein